MKSAGFHFFLCIFSRASSARQTLSSLVSLHQCAIQKSSLIARCTNINWWPISVQWIGQQRLYKHQPKFKFSTSLSEETLSNFDCLVQWWLHEHQLQPADFSLTSYTRYCYGEIKEEQITLLCIRAEQFITKLTRAFVGFLQTGKT